jgi:cell division protein FtsI/penicillin-binding protein 2
MNHDQDIKRIIFLISFVLLVWIILVLRIIQIQIIDRGKYVEKAKIQYVQELKLAPRRGTIYDRNFDYLAMTKPIFSLGLDITSVKDPDYAAKKFADVLGGTKSYYYRQITNGNSFMWLKRNVADKAVHQLETFKLPGLRVIRELSRFYPKQKLAANAIGFTDIDLNGLSGIELTMNNTLTGTPGMAFYQKDATGKTLTELSSQIKEPKSGNDIVLTMDNAFQLIAQEELSYTISHYDAENGMVLITNPMNGEILAMAGIPTFDPNSAGDFPPNTWRNRIITDAIEPGSTIKPIFMSILLEEGLKKPDDMVFCENGKFKIYDNVVEDVEEYGWLTLRKVITKSSNIGMSKLALETDKDLLFRYLRDFGFGVIPGSDLAGEVAGELKNPVEWSRNTPLAISRGYEISVSPLQLAMAYGVIANGGRLLKPTFYYDEAEIEKKKLKKSSPVVLREVISKNTCDTLVSFLEEVVKDGTGARAAIPGVRVAGKTGTARKFDVERQAYSTNEYVASFIGFFPVENPTILIYIMIDKPKKEYLGGVVAASTFKRIAQRLLRTMEIEKSREVKKPILEIAEPTEEGDILLPNLVSKRFDVGKKILDQLGLDIKIANEGEIIVAQEPAAGTKIDTDTQVKLTLADIKKSKTNYTKVPKVVGLTIREAMNKFSIQNLQIVVQGSGRVVRQTPSPGEKIRIGARCIVECEPIVNLAEFESH